MQLFLRDPDGHLVEIDGVPGTGEAPAGVSVVPLSALRPQEGERARATLFQARHPVRERRGPRMTPAAYAVGLARHAADGRLLDAWFPRANVGEHPESGAKIRARGGRRERLGDRCPLEDAERLLETIHGINADTIREPAAGRRRRRRSCRAR